MKIKISEKKFRHSGVLIVPIFKDLIKKIPDFYDKELKDFIGQRVKKDGFEGKKFESIESFVNIKDFAERIVLLGCGNSADYTPKFARELGGKIAKHVASSKVTEAGILLLDFMNLYIHELTEGILLMQHKFDTYKTTNLENKVELKQLNFLVEEGGRTLHAAIEKADIIASGVEYVKTLVNSPSNAVDAEYLAKEAKNLARKNDYKIAIINKKDMVKMKWGGILAVNQGSNNEPKCLVLEYRGSVNKKEKPIVIVGKGILFDTGGYNLKPTGAIETMHQDMAGAATVLGVFEIIKELGIKKNVIGVIPVAENLINENAYRPSDIITMFSGNTVEITNTDAEGRLILADAVHYATKLDPAMIITIATLTGAVSVALGNRYAGLIANDEELSEKLFRAGEEVDELLWPLPLHDDYRKKMNSEIADFRNADLGSNRYAGSSKGAAFIEKFVGDHKWCHIDIGGTAFTEDPKEYEQKGATGHGLRALIKFLER